MSRITRPTSVLLALLALLLVAASCGGSSDSGTNNGGGQPATDTIALPSCPVDAINTATAPVDVTLWYQLSGKAGQTLVSQVAAYNASQSKVRVTAELQGASYDELLNKYTQGIPSKDLPQILVSDETSLQTLIDSKTVLPAQSCFNASGQSLSGFSQAAVDYYSVNGAMWPGTVSLSNLLTYYNKNHFRRAGLNPDTPPTTLDQVRQYAEAIKASGVTDAPVVMLMDSWFIETQLTGAEQTLVNNDNGRGPDKTTQATFDAPATEVVFNWINQMAADGLLTPVQATPGQVDHYLAMATQKASITIETSTAATSVVAFLGGDTSAAGAVGRAGADVTGLDIGAGQVFGVDQPGQAQIGGNGFYIMNTSTPEQISGAWDFLTWWNQLDQQVTWNLDGSYLPFLNAAAQDPRVQAFWNDQLAGQWLKIAYGQLQNVNPNFTGALIGPYDKFRLAMRDALSSVSLQQAQPTQAIATATRQTNDALTAYNNSF